MTSRSLGRLTPLVLALGLLGALAFVTGIGAEYLLNRSPTYESSPSTLTWLALCGLGVAAAMFVLLFVAVALLLGVQTRRMGAGYGQAYRLIESFKFDEAILLLERLITQGKESANTLLLLASAYAYAGKLARAQQIADRAIATYPDEVAAYLTLSNVYRMQAAYDAAADVLRQATQIAPQSPGVWAELGFMLLYAGDEDAAYAALQQTTEYPMPAMYAVRVYYQLANWYAGQGLALEAARAAAKMVSARDGLSGWESGLEPLQGTSYGQRLAHELERIAQALQDADASHTG